ncbi:MAG: hypothetical protein JW891_16795 [Candidatus Lokiarchaeota archaeon]|nr:hypothetical protein [Candidatus Lokiarchaeota archaeon]
MTLNMLFSIVPATGMSEDMQIILLGITLPIIGSIITVLIFPRLLAPLFLKAKNKILSKKYKDAFILVKPRALKGKVIAKRLIYVLAISIVFLLLLVDLLDPTQWLDAGSLQSYADQGIDPKYHITFLLTCMGLMFPIGMGIWAISWAIEDSGLVHYMFREDGYYEIEPIHIRYTLYVKGFASLASLAFLFQYFYDNILLDRFSDSLLVFAILLVVVGIFVPAYFIYAKVMKSNDYLKKGLEEVKTLKESDIKK